MVQQQLVVDRHKLLLLPVSYTHLESAKTLKIINESGEEISLNLSEVASASAVTTELAKKLNIGASGDASTVQSYYCLLYTSRSDTS